MRASALPSGSRGRHRAFDGHPLQFADQIPVVAFGLGFGLLEPVEHFLQPVDGREDQRHGTAGHRHAVAEFAHQRFGGVRECFQPRQPEESAGAFDGVNEAENIIENLRVVRLLLETNEFDVDRVETFVRLGEELAQQVVHREKAFVARHGRVRPLPFGNLPSVLAKRLRIGCLGTRKPKNNRARRAVAAGFRCLCKELRVPAGRDRRHR